MPALIKTFKWAVTILAVLVLTIYFVRAFDSRNMAELGPEHRARFEHEFDASREQETDWQAYLQIEQQLQVELAETVDASARESSPVDRYADASITAPGSYPNNWNHSYEISVASPRGVAVLLHGLTDSPYSMLATAEVLADAGYNVVVPRAPGHGFAVGGLRQARWEDWAAAVRVAVRHARTLPGSEQRFLLGGYSNGGLMAVDYALQCEDIDDLPCPNGLILLSPAIAISSLAVASNLHAAVSWMPYFDRFQWQSVLPEVDPFKFTSFPKRPAWEMHKVSQRAHERLAQPGGADGLPPVVAFQSVVDNTINARALVDILFDKLPANGSELVAYDINRTSTTVHLMKVIPEDPVEFFESLAPARFSASILRNQDDSGAGIAAWRLAAGKQKAVSELTDLSWPSNIYSLSHIAVPFRPDDRVYGDGSFDGDSGGQRVVFGALAPRGERGVMMLTSDYFLRTRYNPFFSYQAARLTEWLNQL